MFAAVKLERSKLSRYTRERLAEASGQFAEGAHHPVLQISKKQNRELPYANVCRGKPFNENGTDNLSWCKKLFKEYGLSLQKGRAGLWQSRVNGIVRVYEVVNT